MKDELQDELINIGNQILAASRSELYLNMRFLDLALSGLAYEMHPGINFMGTDGNQLFYDPDKLIYYYRQNRIQINRAYLHVVLHCVFRHLWKKRRENKRLWNLACDIAMEYVLDGLQQRCIRIPPSWFRQGFYDTMSAKLKVPTAEKLYVMLENMELPVSDLSQLEQEFRIDDHSFWPDPNKKSPNNSPSPQQKWEDISNKMQTNMETFSRDPAKQSKALLEQVKVENRERYDFRRFLKKFSVLHEEQRLDLDSFDPILYTYGMQLYGNMPLVEPQETREVRKVEDFVIAIDTSMSCSGKLVRSFLEQTYAILKDTESFFQKVNIHIIQCDETVRVDQKVASGEELRDYMNHFELVGNGGTDFRPVFHYVDDLIKQKAFARLKGLIYFTDGQGIFPKHRPPYETAFVFLRDDYSDADVPPWAMKLILEPDSLETPLDDQQPDQIEDSEELPHYEY